MWVGMVTQEVGQQTLQGNRGFEGVRGRDG